MARPIKDETGNRYGTLFVLGRAGSDKWKKPTWRCLCDCGKVTIAYGGNLRRGLVRSCGHTQDRSCQITHGHTIRQERTATYGTWRAMRARCYNPDDIAFKYYGARGIGVCVRWHVSTPNAFRNFLAEIRHTIEPCPSGYRAD